MVAVTVASQVTVSPSACQFVVLKLKSGAAATNAWSVGQTMSTGITTPAGNVEV